jgi:hypothetical protein
MTFSERVSAAVIEPPTATFSMALLATPRAIVSVAPLLTDCEKLVLLSEQERIKMLGPDAVALTPIALRLLSAETAAASEPAMVASVSPDCTE